MSLVIEMVSDLVCPWCWLGLRRMKTAMELVPELGVELVFRPFELDPTIPSEGVDYKAYMKQRFGSDENRDRSNAMREALVSYGKEEGIPFNFNAITRRPNSFDAHRLVRWAQGQGYGMEAKEKLFQAVFAKGEDIGDRIVLTRIAEDIGLDPAIVADLFERDADTDAVRDEQDLFRRMGVAGVPTYIAHRQIAVQGAESAEKLARFLKTAAAQLPEERPLNSVS